MAACSEPEQRRKPHEGHRAVQTRRSFSSKIYVDGRPVYESTRTTERKVAERILRDRRARVNRGEYIVRGLDRITDGEADLLAHYEATGSRDLGEAGYRLAHLDLVFKDRRIATISPGDADSYTKRRRAEGRPMAPSAESYRL